MRRTSIYFLILSLILLVGCTNKLTTQTQESIISANNTLLLASNKETSGDFENALSLYDESRTKLAPHLDNEQVDSEIRDIAKMIYSEANQGYERVKINISILQTKSVLDKYNEYFDTETLQDDIYNLKNQIPFTTGLFREYLETIKENSEGQIKFVTDLNTECIKVASSGVCDILQKPYLTANVRKYTVVIKNMNSLEINENNVTWEIERRVDNSGIVKFEKISYVLIKKDENWFIFNKINEDGTSIILTANENIKKLKNKTNSYIDSKKIMLDYAKNASNDKCWLIQYDDKLTATESENEGNLCYTSKYNDFAVQNKDTKICDQIFENAYRIGNCYAVVAVSTNDVKVCDNMQNKEYTAKGYNEPLNSKDLCYDAMRYSNIRYTDKIASCNKIINTQLKEYCITSL